MAKRSERNGMDVTFERYETAGETTRTDTMTITDAKWTNELSKFMRDWFGVAKPRPTAAAFVDRAMPWQSTDVNGEVLE